MIRHPYEKGKDYDQGLPFLIGKIQNSLTNKDDDFLVLCVGSTGSGKTSLMFHAYELFDKNPNVFYIALTRADFSRALHKAAKAEHPRFVCNDEANISKRDSLTKYNKDLIDLYMSIRGLNIFNWWNNPSLEMIDKFFIKERIKGVIFVATKDVKRPRLYYYFPKKSLLQIHKKYGDLSLDLLKKVAKKYALWRGWFKVYKGELWQEYLIKKGVRMTDKVDDFYKKYGMESKPLKTTNSKASASKKYWDRFITVVE